MWSIGIITAVILLGHPFGADEVDLDKEPGTQIMHNASKMDLRVYAKDPDWIRMNPRPKDFIKRLVTSEIGRMTADQALKHHWFTNRRNKDNYELLYHREEC